MLAEELNRTNKETKIGLLTYFGKDWNGHTVLRVIFKYLYCFVKKEKKKKISFISFLICFVPNMTLYYNLDLTNKTK